VRVCYLHSTLFLLFELKTTEIGFVLLPHRALNRAQVTTHSGSLRATLEVTKLNLAKLAERGN